MAGEDRFVLEQAKRKAVLRVREGRAKPIDWLAVTLRFIEPSRSAFEDDVEATELDVVDPEGVFEGLDDARLEELEKDINIYLTLEKARNNRDFWDTMMIICRDRRQKVGGSRSAARGAASVSADVDKLFVAKTFEQLETLERQINAKLRSDEPIDYEYWENLLKNLVQWKARARLRQLSQSVVHSQLQGLRKQEADKAQRVLGRLHVPSDTTDQAPQTTSTVNLSTLDPDPLLKIRAEDKMLDVQDEKAYLAKIVSYRLCITCTLY